MHDPLAVVLQTRQPHAEITAVELERSDHVLGDDVEEWPLPVPAPDGGDGRCKGPVGAGNRSGTVTEPVQGLPTRDLVYEIATDEQPRLARRQLPNCMEVPNFF